MSIGFAMGWTRKVVIFRVSCCLLFNKRHPGCQTKGTLKKWHDMIRYVVFVFCWFLVMKVFHSSCKRLACCWYGWRGVSQQITELVKHVKRVNHLTAGGLKNMEKYIVVTSGVWNHPFRNELTSTKREKEHHQLKNAFNRGTCQSPGGYQVLKVQCCCALKCLFGFGQNSHLELEEV